MSTKSNLQVRQILCIGCGAKINIHTGLHMKTFVCESCGSVCTHNQVVAVQNQQEIKEKYAPQRYLKLGLKGNFLGQQYQIVGRIRYEASDDEDTWTWDEWFLMSSTGYPIWLQEDETGFTLMRKYVPVVWIDYSTDTIFHRAGNMVLEYTKKELTASKIIFLEGELTWKAIPDETPSYIDYSDDEERKLLSIKYSKKEIQYFQGIKLTDNDMLAAFPYVAQPSSVQNEQFIYTTQKHKKASWAQVSLFALILALLSFSISIILNHSGTKFFETTVSMTLDDLEKEIEIPQKIEIPNDTVVGFTFKSSDFKYGPHKYEIGWWFSLELYRQTADGMQKLSAVIDDDFWKEAYDEDEYSDSKFNSSAFIKLQKGTYTAVMTYALDRVTGDDDFHPVKFTIEIRKNAWNSFPFKIAGWILFAFGGLIVIIKLIIQKNVKKRKKSKGFIWNSEETLLMISLILLIIVIPFFITMTGFLDYNV